MEQVEINNIEYLDLYMTQHPKGIAVRAKVHPSVENFFKEQSTRLADAAEWHALWSDFGGAKGMPVPVYHNNTGYREINNPEYSVGIPGYDLNHEGLINLSFLRIVGISDGISFFVKTPISKTALRELKTHIGRCVYRFVQDHLTPVTVRLTIVSHKDVMEK